MLKSLADDGITMSGFVKSFAVEGDGANSAEIVIGFATAETETAYAVYAPPRTEPCVFSSFASLLTAAYLNNAKIDLTYVNDDAYPTPRITRLVIPSKGN
jgi:hypothetical protein